MEDVERIFKATAGEMEKMLNSKTVVGEPIVLDGRTIIPLISVGFGFGAGGGSGKKTGGKGEEGVGLGTGGGGGIRPVAVLIVDKDGVRLEAVKGGAAQVMENLGESLGKIMSRRSKETSEAK